MKQALVFFGGWLCFTAGVCLLIFSHLQQTGYDRSNAAMLALVFCCLLELLLVPLFLCAFPDNNTGIIKATAATFAGTITGGLVFTLLSTGITFQVISSQLIIFAFTFFVIAFSQTIKSIAGEKAGRFAAMVLVIFMLSSSFWSGGIEALSESPGADLSVWLCPQAMISCAFDGFNYAHMPQVYIMWLGPIAPLPFSFWIAALEYLVPGLLLLLLNLALKNLTSGEEENNQREADAS